MISPKKFKQKCTYMGQNSTERYMQFVYAKLIIKAKKVAQKMINHIFGSIHTIHDNYG